MKVLVSVICICFFMFSCGDNATKAPELKEVVKPVYAKGFEIHKFADGSADLIILNPMVSGDTLQVIHWKSHPVNHVGALESSHIVFLSRIHKLSKLNSANFEKMTDLFVLEKIGRMELVNLGYQDVVADLSILEAKPDILFARADEHLNEESLKKGGVQIVRVCDYLETHPLARLEWIKVFAFLLEEQDKADKVFAQVSHTYDSLAKLVHVDVSARKRVLLGSPSIDWYSPSGNRIYTQMISDAGGVSVLTDSLSASAIHLSVDQIDQLAENVDYLGVISGPLQKHLPSGSSAIPFDDEWVWTSKAYHEHHLFYCDLSESNFYSEGILEPHVMLQDLIHVLQPSVCKATGRYFTIYKD